MSKLRDDKGRFLKQTPHFLLTHLRMRNLKMINRYFLESKDNIKDWFQKNLAPNPRMK
jgi:hypothetical protein